MLPAMKSADRLIVALDVPTLSEALRLLDQLAGEVSFVKVGLELIIAEGAPKICRAIHDRGLDIFLDGKYNDIPNTIAAAARESARLGVKLFNVHASAGLASMQSAAGEKGKSLAIAVTVLTSLTEDDSLQLFGKRSKEKVLEFAKLTQSAGLDGVVCSPQELEILAPLQKFLKVTPGVRPEWAGAQDQKRVMTPGEAIRQGATHLVVGRPITQPPKSLTPKEAARKVLEEIEAAL